MSDILSTVQFDTEGYMKDAKAWTKEIGAAIAKREGLEINERHWVVINYARKIFETTGDAPALRAITKNSGVDTKELYSLFPGGPAKLAAKVSGLPKPTGCI